MPIYEYSCSHCATRFEKLVWRTGEDVACPSCQGRELTKLISPFAVLSGGPAARPFEACAAAGPAGPCGGGPCGGGGCALAD